LLDPIKKLEFTRNSRKKTYTPKRKARTKKIKMKNVKKHSLPRLLIKIERMRKKMNSISFDDKQKLLSLSQKLDKFLVVYQRALLKNMMSN